MAKTKFFRVLTEGATTDGRTIKREWIEQMARNYNPEKYGARVWLEHMRGMLADGPFKALGDVVEVKSEELDDGRLALFARLDPTDDLVNMNKQRQKVYTSAEVDPEFADMGEAYLTGLAVTDSPASLSTEMLQFSAKAEHNPLASRKQRTENLFTEAVETALEFEDASGGGEDRTSLLSKVRELFRSHQKDSAEDLKAFRQDLEQTMELFVERISSVEESLKKQVSGDDFSQLKQAHESLKADLGNLRQELNNTPDTPARPSATGAPDGTQTDC